MGQESSGNILSATDYRVVIGLMYFAGLIAAVLLYIVWNVVVNGRKPVRRAERDSKALERNTTTREKISKSVGGLVTANATFSGLAFAALVVMVILTLDSENIDALSGLRKSILFSVMGLIASATLMWFVSLDQLPLMLSPTTCDKQFMRFYKFTFNLWIVAGTLLLASVLLLILIVSPVIAMVMATLIVLIYLRYWWILQEWSFKPSAT